MHNEIFLKQMKRSKKTILYLLLLTVAISFFVGSVNLYSNSTKNLEKAEETYSTLVVTELYGDIDRYGNLVEKNSEEHIGYEAVGVEGYDFSELIDSEVVESWDIRTPYAAYIEDSPAMLHFDTPRTKGRFIRFKTKYSEPITLKYDYDPGGVHFGYNLELDVLEDPVGCFNYSDEFVFFEFQRSLDSQCWQSYQDQIKRLNRSEYTDGVILYPDVEYVACFDDLSDWEWSDEKGILQPKGTRNEKWPNSITFDIGFSWHDNRDFRVTYDLGQEHYEYLDSYDAGAPFPIQRWEDVQNDPALKAYYEDAFEDSRIQHYIHNVVLTNDFSSIPAYHIGGASLKEGRLITEEEYEEGANVCIVSRRKAIAQNWKIGDKLPLHIYETFYVPVYGNNVLPQPTYDSDTDVFIHETEYEIVGIYDLNPTVGNSGISANTLDMSYHNIYIPEKSVQNCKPVEERHIHGSLFSVKIKNGSIDEYLNDMEAKGITAEKDGQFNPKFSFYDQGYSLVQPGLQSMNTTAKLLIALSTVLLLIVCSLLAYFFWQNQKATVGIFRLLGGTKKNALIAVLLCALILCGIGTAIGGAAGFGMAEVVGSSIIEENLSQSERDTALQAYVLGAGDAAELAVAKADPVVTIAACGAVLIFPILLLGFIAKDINKEPRELLPKSKV